MKTRALLGLSILLGLSACKEADSTILVNVSINPEVSSAYSLRVAMSSAQTHDTKIYPASPSATPLPSSVSFVIVLPRARSGRLDLTVDGINSVGTNVAHGTGQTTVVVGGGASVSVVLVAGASLCGNGVLDTSETCDDGNRFSFDGCDFRCQVESARPDAAGFDSPEHDALATNRAMPDAVRGESLPDSLSAATGADAAIVDAFVSNPPLADARLDLFLPSDPPVILDAPADLAKPDAPSITDTPADAVANPASDAALPGDIAPICAPQPKSTGGMNCPKGNCDIGGYSGPAFSTTDGVTSTICMSPNRLCAAGQTPAYSSITNNWGVQFGFDTTAAFPISPGRGLSISLSSLPTSQTIRVNVMVAGTPYCAAMTGANQTIAWKDFYTECWRGGGVSLATVAPTTATSVFFAVNSSVVAGAFDVCVLSLSLVQVKLPLGANCTVDDQCQSTHCTDGVCCGVASCTTPGNTCATCANSTNGVPNGQCGARCPICNCIGGNCSC